MCDTLPINVYVLAVFILINWLYIVNNNGSNTDPCGTPHHTGKKPDLIEDLYVLSISEFFKLMNI